MSAERGVHLPIQNCKGSQITFATVKATATCIILGLATLQGIAEASSHYWLITKPAFVALKLQEELCLAQLSSDLQR